MLPIHERMAELWTKQTKGKVKLSPDEEIEMLQCLQANASYAGKLARLHNLSLMASMTNDYDWLHDICADIEKLELQYQTTKKKPGSQGKRGPKK